MSAVLLPAGFHALEPYAERWAGDSAARRAALRDGAAFAELQSFYDAAHPLLGPALDYLDTRPLNEFDGAETRLMRLMLTFAHVAMAVEVQRDGEARHAGMRAHLRILRTPADSVPTLPQPISA